MSIGYKKIYEIIENESNNLESLTDRQKSRIITLCQKIYLMESSTDKYSAQKMIDEIMGEISHAASIIVKDQGVD